MSAELAGHRRPRALPILLGAFALAVTIASVPLSIGDHPVDTIAYTFLAATMAAAGTLVAVRVRNNPIGWLMLAIGLEGGIGEALEGWGQRPELPASDVVAWVSASLSYVGIGLLIVLLVLFPTGALPSRRWRAPFWILVAAIPVSAISSAFSHSAQRYASAQPNPIAAPGPVADAVFVASQLAFLVGLITAIASIVVRYRLGGPVERQQLKWVAFSTALLAVVGPIALAFYYVSAQVQIAIAVVIMTVPITITIAVLRYRLYAIDRIISRTASYAIVTVLVVGAYALVVVGATAVIPTLPAVGVALATLAAAALFLPALRRVQRIVDRRFDRERYDGQKVLEAFGERLRNGGDPHRAAADLGAAVEATMQPAAMGLWITGSVGTGTGARGPR